MARRTSMANSRRSGATGKYVKRPRRRLAASGMAGTFPADIAQRLFSQHLRQGELERAGFVRALGGQALQFDGETSDVDAVTHRVALIGGVRELQKVGDVVQDTLFGEGEILLEN